MAERLYRGTPVELAKAPGEERGTMAGQPPIDPINIPEDEEGWRLRIDKHGAEEHLRGDDKAQPLNLQDVKDFRELPPTERLHRGKPVESALEQAGTHGGRDKGPFGRLALDPRKLADVGQVGAYTLTHPLEALERAGGFVGSAIKGWAERPQRAAAKYEPGVEDPEETVTKEATLSGPLTMGTAGTLRALRPGARAGELAAGGGGKPPFRVVETPFPQLRDTIIRSREMIDHAESQIARARERLARHPTDDNLSRKIAVAEQQLEQHKILHQKTVEHAGRAQNLLGTLEEIEAKVKSMMPPKKPPEGGGEGGPELGISGAKLMRQPSLERQVEELTRKGLNRREIKAELEWRYAGELDEGERITATHVARLQNRLGLAVDVGGASKKVAKKSQLPPDDFELGVMGGRPPRGPRQGPPGREPFEVVESNVPSFRDVLIRMRKSIEEGEEYLRESKRIVSQLPPNDPLRAELAPDILGLETSLASQKITYLRAVEVAKHESVAQRGLGWLEQPVEQDLRPPKYETEPPLLADEVHLPDSLEAFGFSKNQIARMSSVQRQEVLEAMHANYVEWLRAKDRIRSSPYDEMDAWQAREDRIGYYWGDILGSPQRTALMFPHEAGDPKLREFMKFLRKERSELEAEYTGYGLGDPEFGAEGPVTARDVQKFSEPHGLKTNVRRNQAGTTEYVDVADPAAGTDPVTVRIASENDLHAGGYEPFTFDTSRPGRGVSQAGRTYNVAGESYSNPSVVEDATLQATGRLRRGTPVEPQAEPAPADPDQLKLLAGGIPGGGTLAPPDPERDRRQQTSGVYSEEELQKQDVPELDWSDRVVEPMTKKFLGMPELPNIEVDAGRRRDYDASDAVEDQWLSREQYKLEGGEFTHKIKGEAGEDRLEEQDSRKTDAYYDEEGNLVVNITKTPTPRIGATPEGEGGIEALVEPAAMKERELKDRPIRDRPMKDRPLKGSPRIERGTPVPVEPQEEVPEEPKKDLIETSGWPEPVKEAARNLSPFGIYHHTTKKNAERLYQAVNDLYQAKTVAGKAWGAFMVLGSSYAYAYSPIESLGAWLLGRPFETATGLKGSQEFIGEATSMAATMSPAHFQRPVQQLAAKISPKLYPTNVPTQAAPNIIGQASSVTRGIRESGMGQELKGLVTPLSTEPVTYVRNAATGATATTSAARMARTIMPWSAALARTTAQAERSVREFKGVVARMTRDQRFHFMDLMETPGGIARMPAEWQPLANHLRGLMDARVATMQTLKKQSTGKRYLDNPIPNYFPHIWEIKDTQTQQVINGVQQQIIRSAARRPLRGSGDFLMPRSVASIKLGMKRGLKLVTDNPIELTMIKLREMDKFYFGTKMAQELRKSSIMRWYGTEQRKPHGWEQVGAIKGGVDQAFVPKYKPKGSQNYVVSGGFYAPKPVAQVMNNYLSQRLHGHWQIYDAFRHTGNAMNSLQLSLSLFHAIFTTLDVSISTSAMGMQQLSRGEKLRGTLNMLYGATPIVPTIANLYRGRKLFNAYFDTLGATPAYQEAVKHLIAAGGRANMDKFYQIGRQQLFGGFRASQSGPKFTDRFRYHPITDAVLTEYRDHKLRALLKIPAHLASGMLNDMAWPIMEWLVPRQKLGVFHMMYGDWVRRNPAATTEQTRVAMQQIWQSIDNRLGQMVYDNLFWHNVQKDLAFLTVRSVGWNIGTINEIAGGAADAMTMVRQLNEGQKLALEHRLAYTIMLPVITGLYGATLTYMMTGHAPKKLLDYICPPTGNKTPQGGDECLPIPSYMKDLYSINEDWTHAGNKLHPFWALTRELITDKNYWGAMIYDPRDPAWDQINDQFNHAMSGLQPFSMQSYQRMAKEGRTWEAWLSFLGLQLAPGYMTDPNKEAKDERQLDRARRRRDRARIRYEQ